MSVWWMKDISTGKYGERPRLTAGRIEPWSKNPSQHIGVNLLNNRRKIRAIVDLRFGWE